MLPFVLLLSCAATSPYFINKKAHRESDKLVRQCNLPIMVGSHYDVTALRADRVTSALKHWNEVTDTEFFFDLGYLEEWKDLPDMPMDGFVVIRIKEDEEMRDGLCGLTYFAWDVKGCIKASLIHINPRCLKHGDDIFETIVRHELGHLLGLTHVNDFTKLMNPKIEETLQHPVDVSSEEAILIKRLYGR